MLVISQVTTPSEIGDVQGLLREYTAWAFTLTEGSEQAPTFQGLEEELATLPGIYSPPAGHLLIAMSAGKPAGCIALKPHHGSTAELKRLYVRPSFRGQNLGSHLVAKLIEEARRSGYRRLILDSHASMTKAHEIYMAAGFRRIEPPEDFPQHLKPLVVFMEMPL